MVVPGPSPLNLPTSVNPPGPLACNPDLNQFAPHPLQSSPLGPVPSSSSSAFVLSSSQVEAPSSYLNFSSSSPRLLPSFATPPVNQIPGITSHQTNTSMLRPSPTVQNATSNTSLPGSSLSSSSLNSNNNAPPAPPLRQPSGLVANAIPPQSTPDSDAFIEALRHSTKLYDSDLSRADLERLVAEVVREDGFEKLVSLGVYTFIVFAYP